MALGFGSGANFFEGCALVHRDFVLSRVVAGPLSVFAKIGHPYARLNEFLRVAFP